MVKAKKITAPKKARKPRQKQSEDELWLVKEYGLKPIPPAGGVSDEGYHDQYLHAKNWANRALTEKEARKELLFWMKENGFNAQAVGSVKLLSDSELYGQAKTAFLANNAWPLQDETKRWMDEHLEVGIAKGSVLLEAKKKEDKIRRKAEKLRDETKESPETLNRREGQEVADEIEDAVFADGKIDAVRVVVLAKGKKSVVLTYALEKLQALKEEVALVGTDDDVTEAYANLGKRKANSIGASLDMAINTINGQKMNKSAGRLPRVKKPKSASIQAVKVKFKERDDEHNLVSANPLEVVGATKVVVFNIQYRKLGVYYAKDDAGFGFKGTTLQNFDEVQSEQKTIRGTQASSIDDKLLAFRKATARKVDQLFADLNTTNTKMTGRFGKDTVILKVYK